MKLKKTFPRDFTLVLFLTLVSNPHIVSIWSLPFHSNREDEKIHPLPYFLSSPNLPFGLCHLPCQSSFRYDAFVLFFDVVRRMGVAEKKSLSSRVTQWHNGPNIPCTRWIDRMKPHLFFGKERNMGRPENHIFFPFPLPWLFNSSSITFCPCNGPCDHTWTRIYWWTIPASNQGPPAARHQLLFDFSFLFRPP